MKRIIVTIGPSIFKSGIYFKHHDSYIYRINGAHSTDQSLVQMTKLIREEIKDPKILIDLPGNKIRTSNIHTPIKVVKNENFSLNSQNINFPDFLNYIKRGQTVYADDSTLRFQVEKISDDKIIFLSFSNGYLKNGKGLHVRGIHSKIPFLFQADLNLINAANKVKLDFVGLSFVRNNSDIKHAKKLIDNDISVIPKVETLSAVKNIDEILTNNEYILVDRGDLSTDVGLEKVPIFQNYIIQKANEHRKGYFLATQFLKNMELKPLPTIAEVNDLYNTFLLPNISGIQLSEETAVGKFPQDCLDVINLMIDETTKIKSIDSIIRKL